MKVYVTDKPFWTYPNATVSHTDGSGSYLGIGEPMWRNRDWDILSDWMWLDEEILITVFPCRMIPCKYHIYN